MKKIILIAIIAITSAIYAQDNTLPNSGNVGIGTLTPTARLDVNGNMKIDSCLHIKDSLLIEDNARIMQDMRVEGETTLLGNTKIDGELTLSNVNYDNSFLGRLLFTDANGKVNGGTPNDLGTIIYSKKCAPDPYGDVLLPVWNNGLNKIYIDCPPVRVGIGTSTPDAKLEVAGLAHVGGLLVGTMSNVSLARIHLTSGAGSNSLTPLMILENNDRRVLQVNADGLLKSREIKIDGLPWADYVFESDYKLLPLNDVESFINQYGHLPNVPSQEEILTDGINIGEMNKILLEKIEELTLHVIELNKRIKELEDGE